ncbi:MAG TPA: STAS domain-containing protein [Terriglobales bacterium]|nr:STAS domain-containing protein [Terriglobales bacterium]
MLQFSVERSAGAVVLHCAGKLVAGNSLNALQVAASRQPAASLILDLQDVETVDAAGLGALLRIWDECSARGAGLKLIHANKYVREVLALTELDSVLEVHAHESEEEELLREWTCAET